MTKVYLIRHAEAEGNIFRRAHGQYNGLIIGRGHKQIKRLSERFADIDIDAVYSSDLTRTCVTAAAIYKPKNLPLNKDKRLREVNMGEWEDISWGDLEHGDPQMMSNFESDPYKWKVHGSEDCQQVTSRMIECISEIAVKHDGQSIALFSHGFAIRSFMQGILNIDAGDITKIPLFDNTAVTLLNYRSGIFTIEYQGDNSHIPAEDSTLARQTWWREEKERVRENLRFLPFAEARDGAMLDRCLHECGIVSLESSVKTTAFLGEQQVGFLWISTIGDSNDEARGRIDCIFVKPELRGKHYAIQMVGEAVSYFRKRHIAAVSVAIPCESDAERFFSAYGFEKYTAAGESNEYHEAKDHVKSGSADIVSELRKYNESNESNESGAYDAPSGWCVMENDYKNWDL